MAYWFFRLNGCLTTKNFVVHPDRTGSQRTDVDVLAVRFPHRCELLTSGAPMCDHPIFRTRTKTDIVLVEAKTGQCELNGPWTKRDDENMHRVLYALGAFPRGMVPEVADLLYQRHHYEDCAYSVRLVALGREENHCLPGTVTQLTWDDVLSFIHRRLLTYHRVKAQHDQWDSTGDRLYRLATTMTRDDFINKLHPGR